jgi:hypothetical protein
MAQAPFLFPSLEDLIILVLSKVMGVMEGFDHSCSEQGRESKGNHNDREKQ